ncbi:MAG: thiosulfate oxidation carrier complex protein SoxZ [Gammaproteobacteria bacterium]
MAKIKIRAKEKNGTVTVKSLLKHPMETGNRKDKKTGNKIPAHYITEVICEVNGKTVMTAYLGPGVSKDPYMSFDVKGAKKGETVKLSWVDNKGESASGEVTIK